MTKWIAPNADDVKDFFSSVVVVRCEQTDTQVANILSAVVNRVRGSISAGGRTPLSSGSGEVPPEGFQHTLVLTACALLSATPNFQFLADGPLDKMRQSAEKWIEAKESGKPASYPKDISEDETRDNVRYGSESTEYDMTTDN